jgi:hypothetical protein
MIVMPSNNSGIRVGYLAGRHPGRIAWLIGPGGWRKPPSWLPVSIDNGAFPAFTKKVAWDEQAFLSLLETAHEHCTPQWVVVPDVVSDKDATLRSWDKWAPRLQRDYPDLPLAMAVQEGMTPADVPKEAEWVFVGGGDPWKMDSVPMWTKAFPGRVHVGRVNGKKRLWECYKHNVTSTDGTGWFRGDPNQLAGLHEFLDITSKAENDCF